MSAPTIRACVATLMVASSPSLGAELYIQPTASLQVEGDTNLDLEPGTKTRTMGNLASLASIFGITTPDSDTNLRPRIEYREYPEDTSDNRLEAYLDFNSSYRGQRSRTSIYGTIEHRDDFGAEFAPATFDNFNPVPPTQPNTGKAVVGETRNSAYVVPTYVYQYSPLLGLGVSGVFQKINYSPSGPTFNTDFNYYFAKAFANYTLGPKSDLSFGGFGARYQANGVESSATGSGALADLDTKWSPLFTTGLEAVYERVDVHQTTPAQVDPTTGTTIPAVFLNNTTNAWGATVNATYATQIGQFKLIGGRLITPSGAGGLYVADQIRTQYDRELTYRWSFTVAVAAVKNRGLSSNIAGDDRSYAQTDLVMKWMIAPTWFVQGGYRYEWEKYELNTSGASNNVVFVKLTYQGLPPQR